MQAHALAVHALGRLARSDAALLTSSGLPKVFCAVASSSVLDARSAQPLPSDTTKLAASLPDYTLLDAAGADDFRHNRSFFECAVMA